MKDRKLMEKDIENSYINNFSSSVEELKEFLVLNKGKWVIFYCKDGSSEGEYFEVYLDNDPINCHEIPYIEHTYQTICETLIRYARNNKIWSIGIHTPSTVIEGILSANSKSFHEKNVFDTKYITILSSIRWSWGYNHPNYILPFVKILETENYIEDSFKKSR